MLIKILELTAFVISVFACIYGAAHLFSHGTPKYFQLYVWAAGCYTLEELWVIVNSLLGNGSEDGLVTVRLFGFFGCLCFILSANAHAFDKLIDENGNRKIRLSALLAPASLLAMYALCAFSPINERSPAEIVIGLLSISPALFASYFSLKHLLLPKDELGILRITRGIDVLSLIFYAANFLYPLADLYCSKTFMSIYDLILTVMLLGIIVLCGRGAVKWKALI